MLEPTTPHSPRFLAKPYIENQTPPGRIKPLRRAPSVGEPDTDDESQYSRLEGNTIDVTMTRSGKTATITLVRKVSSGQFGSVYTTIKDKSTYAVKIQKREFNITELRVMCAIAQSTRELAGKKWLDGLQRSTPPITGLVAFSPADYRMSDSGIVVGALVTDFWAKGNANRDLFNYATAVDFTRGLVNGLSYLHCICHLAHCDIKPDNLCLNGKGQCVIIDLGLAYPFPMHRGHIEQTTIGSRGKTPGNTYFAGTDTLEKKILSPRADLIAALLCLIVWINGTDGCLPWNSDALERSIPFRQLYFGHHTEPIPYHEARQLAWQLITQTCVPFAIINFAAAIISLGYATLPRYLELDHLLHKIDTDQYRVPQD